VTSGSTALVGTGRTDVSTLKIVGTIDPATGKITDTPAHAVSSAPSGATVSPQITQPACNGRIDFYRLVSPSTGATYCFANSGTATLPSGYWPQIMLLCPGNNVGRTEYYYGDTDYWSLWRGKMADNNSCYSFDAPVAAFAVQIK